MKEQLNAIDSLYVAQSSLEEFAAEREKLMIANAQMDYTVGRCTRGECVDCLTNRPPRVRAITPGDEYVVGWKFSE